METLHVPHQNISQYETVFDKIKILHETGAEAIINRVNWENEFPKKMPVCVRVAHDGERLYLYYMVTGEQLRVVNTADFGSVWEDSCVEFFVQREGEATYRNFECNALGVLLVALRENRDSATRLVEDAPSVFRHATVCHRYENGSQVSDWSLYLEIPKKALGFAPEESLCGKKMRANFYKCGDETPEPHYLSWSPIDLPNPDFHVPRFFGMLEME